MHKIHLFLLIGVCCIATVHLFKLPDVEKITKHALTRFKRDVDNDIEVAQDEGDNEASKTVFGVKLDKGKRKEVKTKSLFIGECKNTDALVYQDNTIVDNLGPGVLNGTIEVSLCYYSLCYA